MADPTRYFDYAISSDRYMNNSVTLEAVSMHGTGLVTLDMADARLRASDPGRMLVINPRMEAEAPAPTVQANEE